MGKNGTTNNDTAKNHRAKNYTGLTERMKTYCVYIMAGASGVIYIGVTNDIERRVVEHKSKAVPGFSARYNLTKLVYFEAFSDVRAAIAREKELKGWLRRRKIALIETVNPRWKDLSAKCRVAIASKDEPVTACHPVMSCHSERSEESLRIIPLKQREILRPTKRDSE